MGDLAETQTITGFHPFYGNVFSLLTGSCDVQSLPHWLTNGVVPFWKRIEGRPVFPLACRHNTFFFFFSDHLIKFADLNLTGSSISAAMNWSPVTLGFCRRVAAVILIYSGRDVIFISLKKALSQSKASRRRSSAPATVAAKKFGRIWFYIGYKHPGKQWINNST